MNHDIAHCSNEDCPAKLTCKRYIAHLDAIKLDIPYLTYLINEPRLQKDDGTCIAYWEVKK